MKKILMTIAMVTLCQMLVSQSALDASFTKCWKEMPFSGIPR